MNDLNDILERIKRSDDLSGKTTGEDRKNGLLLCKALFVLTEHDAFKQRYADGEI